MSKSSSRKWAAALLSLGASSVLLTSQGRAQTSGAAAADADNPQSAVNLEKYVVTGSHIPSAGETSANPVQILGQLDIENSGVNTDLIQLLRKTSPQFSGNSNLGVENANIASGSTNGGAQLALRNLSTLVLVNGRRVASAPVAATGGDVFVDVNAIPLAAIDRIEILTDGASAIYGTDAVSGVINIILKSDFRGVDIGARYGFTTNNGHYSEHSAWAVAGGKVGANGPNLTVSFEWNKTDPIYNYQRPFATPDYGTTQFPGLIQLGSFDEGGNFTGDNNGYYLLNSSLSTPKTAPRGSTPATFGYSGPISAGDVISLFDLSHYVTMLMGNEKKIATLNFDQKISNNFSLFGDFIISRTQNTAQLNAQGFRVAYTADDPLNPLGLDVRANDRILTHPRQYIANTDSYRGVFGAKGTFSEHWSWESGLDYSYIKQGFTNAGLIRSAAREADVENGSLNLFESQPTSVPTDIFGEAQGKFASTLTTLDFNLAGSDLFSLPGGGVSIAVGGEFRRETLKATSNPDSQSATFAYDSGTTIDPFSAKRRVYSVYAEAQLPIVGEANRLPGVYDARLILDVRHEDYSDTDNPTVPKFTLSYSPIEDLKLHATFSKSFAAPSLYQIHLPIDIGFTEALAAYDENQANVESTPVLSLAPSRSTNFNYGLIWTPKAVHELSVELDFFQIKQKDVISNLNASGTVEQVFADVDAKGSASAFAQYIHTGSVTGPTISTPGEIAQLGLDNIYYVFPGASNIGTQKVKGFDLKATYVVTLDSSSRLTLTSNTTYYSQYDVEAIAGFPPTPTAGLVTSLNGTIPRWKTYNTITYSEGQFSSTVGYTYEPSIRDTNYSDDLGAQGYPQFEPAFSVWDASVDYTFKGRGSWFHGLKLIVGVNNIGNKLPPLSATSFGNSNADIGEYSPIGRFYYTQVEYKF